MEKSNRLFAILLALAMIVTYMPALAFAEPGDPQDEIEIDSLQFSKDADDAGWAAFYTVNLRSEDAGGKVVFDEDLGLSVLDKDGNDVTDHCDIKINSFWWDDEGRRCTEPKESPYDIYFDDKGNTEGFTAYEVIVDGKEDEGYTGHLEGEFYVVDKYSLNFVCSNTTIGGAREGAWRQHTRLWISEDAFSDNDNDPVVSTHSEKPLEKSSYTATYYVRPEGWEHEEDLYRLCNGENEIEGKPDEAGAYFMIVDGVDPYYGSNLIVLDVGEFRFIDFEGDTESPLWVRREQRIHFKHA